MGLTPKILLIDDRQTTSALEAFSYKQPRWQIVLEPHPARTIQRWMEETPDLVIFDLDPAETTAISLIRDLREQAVMPILMLASNPSAEFMLEAYEAGLDDYSLKPVPALLLQAKIKAWLRRTWTVPVDMLDSLTVGGVRLIPSERSLIFEGQLPVRLTNLELRLMFYLMSHPGRTAAAEEVCQRVWGSYSEGNKTTLKNVVYRLRQKIEMDPCMPHCIRTVAGLGYQFRLDTDYTDTTDSSVR